MLTLYNFCNTAKTYKPIFAKIPQSCIVILQGSSEQISNFTNNIRNIGTYQGKISYKNTIFSPNGRYNLVKNSWFFDYEPPFPNLTVLQYLKHIGRMHCNFSNTKVAMHFLKITSYQNMLIKQLSYQQKQLVRLAETMMFPKDVWFLNDISPHNNNLPMLTDMIDAHLQQGGIIFINQQAMPKQLNLEYNEIVLSLDA